MRPSLAILGCLGLLLAPRSAWASDGCSLAGERVRVMLQDLELAPAFQSQARTYLQILTRESAAVPGFEVISADEVRSALDQEAQKAWMGCDANNCIAEIAAAMDAALVVSGTLSRDAEGGALVALSVLNTRAVVVMNRVVMRWQGAESDLPEVLRAATQTLLWEPALRPPGAIQLLGVPPEARVFLDGVEASAALLQGRIEGVAIGPHEVRVEAPARVPEGTAWVWWTSAGAVLAGGALAWGLATYLTPAQVQVTARLPHVRVLDTLPTSSAAGASR